MSPRRRYREADLKGRAELNLQYFRGLKLAWLLWLSVASLPLWIQCLSGPWPLPLRWLTVLGEWLCFGMAFGYAALEYRFSRRAAEMESGAGMEIHAIWSVWDDVRTALWYGLALVCVFPWLHVAFDREFSPTLFSPLLASAVTILVLLVLAETISRVRWHLSDTLAGRSGRTR